MSEQFETANHSVHTPAWVVFTQLTFGVAVAAMSTGIIWLDATIAAKGYLAMGMLLLIVASINMSKTIRDQHEATRVTRRVEEAKLNNFLLNHDPLASNA